MGHSVFDNGTSIKFKPIVPNDKYEFALVLGAGKIDTFDVDGKTAESNHFRVVFNQSGTSLYSVQNGVKNLVAKSTKNG